MMLRRKTAQHTSNSPGVLTTTHVVTVKPGEPPRYRGGSDAYAGGHASGNTVDVVVVSQYAPFKSAVLPPAHVPFVKHEQPACVVLHEAGQVAETPATKTATSASLNISERCKRNVYTRAMLAFFTTTPTLPPHHPPLLPPLPPLPPLPLPPPHLPHPPPRHRRCSPERSRSGASACGGGCAGGRTACPPR